MLFISAIELQQWIQSNKLFHLIDVREKFEFAQGNIGGNHLPMAEIPEKWESHVFDGKKVVVCRSGKRAEAVANLLEKDFGCSNIYVLDGGLLSWRQEIDHQLDLD